MKSPAPWHITWTASQAVVITYVSSWASNSSDRCSARSSEAVEVSLAIRAWEDGPSLAETDGKLILAITEGHRSFIRGRKLFSFCARTGKICMSIESKERRRYGEGEERWEGIDLIMCRRSVCDLLKGFSLSSGSRGSGSGSSDSPSPSSMESGTGSMLSSGFLNPSDSNVHGR